MNKTIKKALSLVMIVMMVMSVVPMSASADFWDGLACTFGSHDCQWVVTKEATCIATGKKVYKCVKCDKVEKEEDIPKADHDVRTFPAKEPTCTEEGNKEYKKCANTYCLATIVECEIIPATGHTPVDVPKKEATCTEDGYTAGTKCSVCQAQLTGMTKISATDHKWEPTYYKAATCTEPGKEILECQNDGCNEKYERSIEAAHKYGNEVVEKAATCTENGIVKKTCKVCGNVDRQTTDMLAHEIVSVDEVEATCLKTGTTVGKKCKVCGEITEGCDILPALGHDEKVINGTPATCTQKGTSDKVYCARCNTELRQSEEIAASGHKLVYDAENSKAATCTVNGKKVYKCSNAGCTYTETETIEASHKGLTVMKEPTCTEAGSRGGICAVCKKDISEVIPATGHTVKSDLSWTVKTQATCTKDGVMVAKCDVCEQEATKAIPATGHKEVETAAVAPTCTKPGLTAGTRCYYCSTVIVAQEAVPAGHTYDKTKAETVKAATCKEEGTIKYTCTVCKEFITEKTEKLPHTEVKIEAKPYTCTEDGNEEGIVCSVCDAIIKEATVLPATGHAWLEGADSKAPTCTENGYSNKTCSRCGVTEIGTVEATGHQNKETIAGTAPDCLNSGITEGIKCKDCGQWIQEQTTTPALGHDWVKDAEKSTPSTCTQKGLDFYNCSRCKQTNEEEVPVVDHAWSDWRITTEATCNTSGEQQRVCATCNLVESEDIPSGGGCQIVSSDYVAPTCTTPGYTGGTHCEKCGTVYTTPTEIEPLGHKYEDQTIPATTESNGSKSSVCVNGCGNIISEVIPQIETVKLSTASVTYNGKVRTTSVIVVDADEKELVEGTDYDCEYSSDEMKAPGKYTVTVTFKGNYSGEEELAFYIRPGKTASITTTPTAKGTTTISWKAVSGATGYTIYMHNGKNWKVIKTLAKTSYTLTKDYNGKALKIGTQYKICVKARTKDADGNIVYSASYVTKTFKQLPGKVTSLKATSSNGKVNLTWANLTGETGYQIWYSTSKNGEYKRIKNVGADTLKFSYAMTKGKTYYFKVRAYTKVGSGYVYGSYSSVVSCKIK